MRGVGRYILTVTLLTMIAGVVLVGCDKSLMGDNPISPVADARITSIPNGGNALLPTQGDIIGSDEEQAAGGGEVITVTTKAFVFQPLTVVIDIFNGVSVQFTSFRVEYFEEDGSPVFVAPGVRLQGYTRPLNIFVDGGRPFQSFFGSIVPTAQATGVAGTIGRTTLQLDVISTAAFILLDGGDSDLTQNNLDRPILADVTIFGEDVNANQIVLNTRVAIEARLQVENPTATGI